jgi:hypothetical protein
MDSGRIIALNCNASVSKGRLTVVADSHQAITEVWLSADKATSYEVAFSDKSSTFGVAFAGVSRLSGNPPKDALGTTPRQRI